MSDNSSKCMYSNPFNERVNLILLIMFSSVLAFLVIGSCQRCCCNLNGQFTTGPERNTTLVNDSCSIVSIEDSID